MRRGRFRERFTRDGLQGRHGEGRGQVPGGIAAVRCSRVTETPEEKQLLGYQGLDSTAGVLQGRRTKGDAYHPGLR